MQRQWASPARPGAPAQRRGTGHGPGRRRLAGEWAEEAAAETLRLAGWSILARNVRVARDEVDIVALEPDDPPVLVLVEVRSRTEPRAAVGSAPGFGQPEESVDARKVGRLYRAAFALLRAGELPDGTPLPLGRWRVDLVTVVRDVAVDTNGSGVGAWRVTTHLRGLAPP
jgi:Holliday junction resolvase-like predicted endonuclease